MFCTEALSRSRATAWLAIAVGCLGCNLVFGLDDRPGRGNDGAFGGGAGTSNGAGGTGGDHASGGMAGQGGQGGHGAAATGGTAGSGADGGYSGGGGDQPVSRVFITSQTFNGDLGGLDGADAKCMAAAASLGGSWRAGLSGEGTNAIDRIADAAPWKLLSGEVAFASHAQLATGPSKKIERTEAGLLIFTHEGVWTGTQVGGLLSSRHCANWSTGYSLTLGRIGSAFSVTANWTDWSVVGCDQMARLYCFEQ